MVRLWDAETGDLQLEAGGHTAAVLSLAWSPDGRMLASGSWDSTVRFWDAATGRPIRMLKRHSAGVNSLAWSPDGQTVASGSHDHTVRLWNGQTGELRQTLAGHSDCVNSVAWSAKHGVLASGSSDKTIRLWDPQTGKLMNILEGHTSPVCCVSFSADGLLLASKSYDGSVRHWYCGTWEKAVVLDEPATKGSLSTVAFHPRAPALATLGDGDTVVRIWQLDMEALLGAAPAIPSRHYANAKVVLVGDMGVGKTGLALAISGERWMLTESTHGCYVRTFETREVDLGAGRSETRETLLWDLAGQTGYRLTHQLHLDEVAVALVVFDPRSETDPFAGVRYWDRALRQALHVQDPAAPPLKKFLVAGRTDRVGVSVGPARIRSLMEELGFDAYFETSAKDGRNVSELARAIREAIDWAALPKVNSPDLFRRIKVFLVKQREGERLLSPTDDLYGAFLAAEKDLADIEKLRAQFETCIGRMDSRGLIRRLSFGDRVLLKPQLLDAYASAMVNAARDEPDGPGCITEKNAFEGHFDIPDEERIPKEHRNEEKLLRIATVEELQRHEIVLRERIEDVPLLVFPAQSTRERPGAVELGPDAVIFRLEGPVLNICVTLAVRLSRSGRFTKSEIWKNEAVYTATAGGRCGLRFREIEEGRGELTLSFDAEARKKTRLQFEEYVFAHLQRRALPGSIERQRVLACPNCEVPPTDEQTRKRRKRGFLWMRCSVCDEHISLFDPAEDLTERPPSAVPEMDRAADAEREREAAITVIEGKLAANDFDVFLCHNNDDKPAVKAIGEQLKKREILPWLDEWNLRPGLPWQRVLEQQIGSIRSAAVFVGRSGMGPWQEVELAAFLREFVNRGCPVIPVILESAPTKPDLPVFLRGMTWVDFRRDDPDPLGQLTWGITGERAPGLQ